MWPRLREAAVCSMWHQLGQLNPGWKSHLKATYSPSWWLVLAVGWELSWDHSPGTSAAPHMSLFMAAQAPSQPALKKIRWTYLWGQCVEVTTKPTQYNSMRGGTATSLMQIANTSVVLFKSILKGITGTQRRSTRFPFEGNEKNEVVYSPQMRWFLRQFWSRMIKKNQGNLSWERSEGRGKAQPLA